MNRAVNSIWSAVTSLYCGVSGGSVIDYYGTVMKVDAAGGLVDITILVR